MEDNNIKKAVEDSLQDHGHRGHAMLSASAANRWIHCPPSVRLSDGILDRTSGYAEEGTKAHEMAEMYLNGLLAGKDDEVVRAEVMQQAKKVKTADNTYAADSDGTIIDNVALYVDYIINQYNRLKEIDDDTILMPEVQVNYDNVAKGGFGTSDCVIIGGDEIIVIDLKYGKGIEVDALGNPQLRLYAIGALNQFLPLYGSFKTVKMAIVQPRLNHLSEEEMTPEELYSWADTIVKPRANEAYKGIGNFQRGDWCRFCKAQGCCPKLMKENMSVEKDMQENPEVEKLSDEKIAEILEKGKSLVKWYKSLEDYATDKALMGDSIPGYKLVEGRSKKIWTDEDEAAKLLLSAGLSEDDIWSKSLVSPSKALAMIGSSADDETLDKFKELTEKANINPTLVPSSDKREPLSQSVIDELTGSDSDGEEGA